MKSLLSRRTIVLMGSLFVCTSCFAQRLQIKSYGELQEALYQGKQVVAHVQPTKCKSKKTASLPIDFLKISFNAVANYPIKLDDLERYGYVVLNHHTIEHPTYGRVRLQSRFRVIDLGTYIDLQIKMKDPTARSTILTTDYICSIGDDKNKANVFIYTYS